MKTAIPIIEMSAQAYLISISQADDAQYLHSMREDIKADEALFSEEKENLLAAINLRFGQLNIATLGTPKPRW